MSNIPHPNIASVELDEFEYDNKIVRDFAIATILFGLIGMLVGLLAAFQLVFPDLNFDLPYTTFSRIRPLHTNAVIFAFVGNGFFYRPLLFRTPCTPHTGMEPRSEPLSLLGMAADHSGRGHYFTHGFHFIKRICRT